MSTTSPPPGSSPRTPRERWTTEQRCAAFRAYFSSGSRRKARQQTGVPERTLSAWLRDARHAQERRAVQEGLLRAVKEDAEARGADLVEATREAILVCRKALRKDPDGKTASTLLSSLSRARVTEDRIQRLEKGDAFDPSALTDEEREEFEAWLEEKRQQSQRTFEQLDQEYRACMVDVVRDTFARRDGPLMLGMLEAIAQHGHVLAYELRRDAPLARALRDHLETAVARAESDPLPPFTQRTGSSTSWWDSQQEPS